MENVLHIVKETSSKSEFGWIWFYVPNLEWNDPITCEVQDG